jgi:hypothetical protein
LTSPALGIGFSTMTEPVRCYDCGQAIADEPAPRVVWVDGRKLLVMLCPTCDGNRMKKELANRKRARITWLVIIGIAAALFAVVVIAALR